MKKIKIVVSLFLFLVVLMMYSYAFCNGEPIVTAKITNQTDAKIFIAFAEKQTDFGGDDAEEAKDKAKGWWAIDPGQTKIIKPYTYSPFFSVYYYAMTQGGKHVWGGDNNEVDKPFIITTQKQFNYEDGGVKISGGKKVMFKCLDAGMNEVNDIKFVLKK